MTTRPDTWTIWAQGGGLTLDEAKALFGEVKNTGGRLSQGKRGLGTIFRSIQNAVGGNNEVALQAFPPMTRPVYELEHALLMTADDRTLFPVVTYNDEGFRLLTEAQAREVAAAPEASSSEARDALERVAPPGGYEGQSMISGGLGMLAGAQQAIASVTNHPGVQVAGTLAGVGALVYTGWQLISDLWPD